MSKKKIKDSQIDEIIERQEKEPLSKEDEETLTDWIIQLVENEKKRDKEELKSTIVYWLPIEGEN